MTSAGRPNLLFIMSDDHAAHAISAYSTATGRPVINRTPNLDRIAEEGMRFDSCFCTNSICTPSRAAILTGTYNHVNGVTTLVTPMDNTLDTFPKRLQAAGYQTAMFGKWHLGHGPEHDPTGFDRWRVLPGQGHYHNPVMLQPRDDGRGHTIVERGGYVTDLITDDSLRWLERRDPDRPFALLCHHKAPHRSWEPSREHFSLYDDVDIPEPATLFDDHEGRAEVVQAMRMRIMDLDPVVDLKATVPPGLSEDDEIRWRYQRYIKDYLRTIASIDDNVGRMLDWLDANDLAENTIVVYTSDQGFFLGDHGWFDKRMMYEESVAMPLLVRYPALVEPGSVCDDIALNVDFAPTFLELAGVDVPTEMQGTSLAPLLAGGAARRLATVDVLPLLDARRRHPPSARPLRRAHRVAQADRLLQRPARSARRPRAGGSAGVGAVRPRRRSPRAAQRDRRSCVPRGGAPVAGGADAPAGRGRRRLP
jgi:arylsulfatase A-like enzyme